MARILTFQEMPQVWIFGVRNSGETELLAYDREWLDTGSHGTHLPSLKRSMSTGLFLQAVCSARTAQLYSANHPRQILNGWISN